MKELERDNLWLENKLCFIIDEYFSDLTPKLDEIEIKFGRKAFTRLGSIKKNGKKGSLITITGHFQDDHIPEYVIEAVIAHELSHFAHGFCSSLPQLYSHPHQGGIIDLEISKRGMGNILTAQKKWIKENWKSYAKENNYKPRRRRRRVLWFYR